MLDVLTVLSVTCLLLGSITNLIAGIGIFFFSDVYSRMHAAGITDTLGTGLILIGLMLQTGWSQALGKLVLILMFTLITSPTVTYVLANVVLHVQKQKTVNGSEVRRVPPSNR